MLNCEHYKNDNQNSINYQPFKWDKNTSNKLININKRRIKLTTVWENCSAFSTSCTLTTINIKEIKIS